MDLPNGRPDAPNGGVGAEEAMRRRKKVELVQEAIHGVLEERRKAGRGEDRGFMSMASLPEEDAILATLLTKLDALERDADSHVSESEPRSFRPGHQPGQGEHSSREVELADIAKDLGKIRRQNTVTHLLLGAVIVLTAVWQFNEVSFLLWVQNKLSNPFNSLGDMIKASLKLRGRKPVIEGSPLPPVGVPEVSRHDLPTLIIGSTDDSGSDLLGGD